jgi:hypothetical protein
MPGNPCRENTIRHSTEGVAWRIRLFDAIPDGIVPFFSSTGSRKQQLVGWAPPTKKTSKLDRGKKLLMEGGWGRP